MPHSPSQLTCGGHLGSFQVLTVVIHVSVKMGRRELLSRCLGLCAQKCIAERRVALGSMPEAAPRSFPACDPSLTVSERWASFHRALCPALAFGQTYRGLQSP